MNLDIVKFLIVFPIVLFSITIHEVAHGWAALKMGDPTAKYMGRLTLNPIRHLDPVGSLLLPLLLFLTGMPVFGWAKPVPVDFRRLRDQRMGYVFVGLSGPLANISLALFVGLVIRVMPVNIFTELLTFIFFLNMILALFNLIPFPPLDGSRVLFGLLPQENRFILHRFEKYGLIILMVLIFTGAFKMIFQFFFLPVISLFYFFITGYSL
ncbi:MAG: site-2 protease family protein [Candidatus Aureabacteria bacterium]|nr:site-2 protease family protein [Candidatus Auribacterota bacterium]